ncbi:MAG: hypothetical protein ACOY40_14535 [Bacillota bacterium]
MSGVVISTNLNRDSDRKVVQEFIKNYNRKYGYKPLKQLTGSFSWDMARLEELTRGALVKGILGLSPNNI